MYVMAACTSPKNFIDFQGSFSAAGGLTLLLPGAPGAAAALALASLTSRFLGPKLSIEGLPFLLLALLRVHSLLILLLLILGEVVLGALQASPLQLVHVRPAGICDTPPMQDVQGLVIWQTQSKLHQGPADGEDGAASSDFTLQVPGQLHNVATRQPPTCTSSSNWMMGIARVVGTALTWLL